MTDEEKRAKHAAQARRYRAANPDKVSATRRKHYAANKDKLNAATVKYARKRKYGVSQEQFNELLAAQNSACALCFTTEPKGRGSFHVDHCHATGVVRGLLCHSCTTALGLFRDDTALLMRATEYLAASRTIH
jgi:hypothetical protein